MMCVIPGYCYKDKLSIYWYLYTITKNRGSNMHFWRPFNWKNGNFQVFFGIKSQIFSKMDDIDQVSY